MEICRQGKRSKMMFKIGRLFKLPPRGDHQERQDGLCYFKNLPPCQRNYYERDSRHGHRQLSTYQQNEAKNILQYHHLCCDLGGSVRSWEQWLRDTARKRNAFLLFAIFWESFNCYNFGSTGLIQVGFSAKCTSRNKDFNQIENWKCHMLDFRLIPLDRITYISLIIPGEF